MTHACVLQGATMKELARTDMPLRVRYDVNIICVHAGQLATPSDSQACSVPDPLSSIFSQLLCQQFLPQRAGPLSADRPD